MDMGREYQLPVIPRRGLRVERIAIVLTVYAALGVACAISFAFLRSTVAGTFTWPMPYIFGYGPPSDAGTVWSWNWSASFGWHACQTNVVDAAAPRQGITPTGPLGWYEGPAPWWSIAAEQQSPPAAWPVMTAPGFNAVVEQAFGWPFPCASYREHQVTRAPTTSEIATLGLKADDTLVDQTLLLGTHRFAGALTSFGVYDGIWPTRILWRGLVANSLTLGMILALPHALYVIAGALRVAIRRRAGRCPWCGYHRSGLAADTRCPECGEFEPRPR